jgi:hypothetical protein
MTAISLDAVFLNQLLLDVPFDVLLNKQLLNVSFVEVSHHKYLLEVSP